MKANDATRTPLTSSDDPLDRHEMEARLHSILGRFLIAFAKIELNLSLRVAGDGTFAEKLERLLISTAEDTESEDMLCKVFAWYMAADSLRIIRNRLAHGRWGYIVHTQQLAHVLGYPPGPQHEQRFSFGELEAIIRDAELLSNELSRLAG